MGYLYDKVEENDENRDQSIEGFNAAITDFLQRQLPEKIVLATKKIALELFIRLVKRTPVDTGRARANWQISIGQEFLGIINDGSPKPPLGSVPGDLYQQAVAALSGLKPYVDVFITNNIPYIAFLDAGSSDQAPAGIVVVAVHEVQEMIT